MHFSSLQEKIDKVGNPADFLRNVPVGAYVYPIPPEFTNWRDEQRSWRETVGLLDQSLHMTDIYVEGPDTIRLLSELGVNSFAGFGRNKGKQLVCCNDQGYLIGDMVLFGLEDNKANVVGRPPVANWIQYHAESGRYNVKVERDERSISNPQPRKTYRFGIQGPNAWPLLEKLNRRPMEKLKFFHMGEINIAGRKIRALAHAFAGAPGLEIWGPLADSAEVKAVIVEAGKEFGLRLVGGRAYGTVAPEAGWIPSPLQAVYSGERMRPYREWLPATSFEANASIGGSFVSKNIEDYYLTPWDLDYGRFVKFDHDFIGRDALQRMVDQPHRHKVTLEWDADDVLAVYSSQLHGGENAKFMEFPTAHYASHPYDTVMRGGRMVGFSTYPCYLAVDRRWISLGVLESGASETGSSVSVIWGEPDGGSAKPGVERHYQKEIRAAVAPWPYVEFARKNIRPPKAWLTKPSPNSG